MKKYEFTFNAMGGPCSLTLYSANEKMAAHAFESAKSEARRFETKYSRYRDDSVISRINKGEKVELDNETFKLLQYAEAAYIASDGLFDITSGVYRKVWDFKRKSLPSRRELTTILKNVGWKKVTWDESGIQLKPNMEIDLGGIVKEYAADSIRTILEKLGIASGVIELAGDIVVIGPHPDGSPWRIGIRHPDTKEVAANLSIKKGAMASSGDYERFIKVYDKRYCHIINPKTGMPSQGVASVTVIAPLCVMAGTLSTVAMLNNVEHCKDFLDKTGLQYVLFLRDKKDQALMA